ncbi:MAG: protein kinase [Planctomycetales bacterium]|nr:protein kinase [Planctomycetales bacterium]
MTDETQVQSPSNLSRDERLELVLAEYLRQVEQAGNVDQQALLQANPDLADDLREFFANQLRMQRLVGAASIPISRNGAAPTKLRYFGDYEILEEIAHGGMGVVYKACQTSLNRLVAVKMILAGQLANESDVKRFQAEAEAAANLHHPGVVGIYEVGVQDGQHYYSMEYIDGQNLAQAVREKPLAIATAAEYVRDIATILEYAHQQKVLHRDLKPSNILIDASGRVRITDFGLAKRVEGESNLTITGQVLGTPSYMSPEQAAAQHAIIGPPTDIYALGAILYELVTGRPPFRSESIGEILRQVQHDEPVRPRLLNPKLPRDLETICLKCLEKEPKRRYGSAQVLADELGRFLRGEPILARRIGPLSRGIRWCRRNPVVATSGATAGVLLVAVLVISMVAYFRESSLRQVLLREQANTTRALQESETSNSNLRMQSGLSASEQGDAAAAAVWFAAAAELMGEEDVQSRHNRLRAALWNDHAPRPVKAVMHPEEWVLDVKFHPSGKYLLTWSPRCGPHKGRCIVWDLETEREIPLRIEAGNMSCSAWSPDGTILAMGTDRGRFVLQKFPQGAITHDVPLEGRTDFLEFDPTGRYLAVTYGAREAASPTDQGMKTGTKVRVWDLLEGRFATPELPQPASVSMLMFHPRGTQLVVGHSNSTCCAYAIPSRRAEPQSPSLITRQRGPSSKVGERPARPIYLSGGRQLLTFDFRDLKLWDTESWMPIPLPPQAATLNNPPEVTALTPNQETVVVGTNGGVALIASDSLQRQRQIRPNKARQYVFVAAISPDGKHLLSGGAERLARIWTLPDAQPVGPPVEHGSKILAAAWSPDGERFATAEHGGLVRVWTPGKTLFQPVPLHPPGGLALLSPSGKFVTSRGSTFNNTGPPLTRVYSTADGRPAGAEIKAGGRILGAAFSPDERELALLTGDGDTLTVVDWRTGEVRQPALHLESQPRSIGYRPRGSEIGVLCADGQIIIVDAKTLSVRARWSNQVAYSKNVDYIWNGALEFSADGESLITFQTDRAVRVWNAGSGLLRYQIDQHLDRCVGIALSRDGARLATASFDHSARIWDFATGQSLSAPLLHPDKVHSARFHLQGELLVTSCRDGLVRVWEWRSGRLACPAIPHEHEVHASDFTPDGRFVVTASEDNTARVWESLTGKPVSPPILLNGGALNLEVTPDGRRLVVGGFANGKLDLVSLDALFDTDPLEIHDRRLFAELSAGRGLDRTGLATLPGALWHSKWEDFKSRQTKNWEHSLIRKPRLPGDVSAAGPNIRRDSAPLAESACQKPLPKE